MTEAQKTQIVLSLNAIIEGVEQDKIRAFACSVIHEEEGRLSNSFLETTYDGHTLIGLMETGKQYLMEKIAEKYEEEKQS